MMLAMSLESLRLHERLGRLEHSEEQARQEYAYGRVAADEATAMPSMP